MLIIDFHCHTSTKPMHGLHTTSASLDTLEVEARKYGIETTVVLATYFPLKGSGVHNSELLDRIEGREQFIAFGSLDVMNNLKEGIQELRRLSEEGSIFGIKLYPGYQGFEPGDDRLNELYALAWEQRLPIMIHGGELHHCCPAEKRTNSNRPCGLPRCELDGYINLAHPWFVRKPALAYPGVKFVVSHLANPHFKELREVMRECPNVYTDISGQFVSGTSEATDAYRELIVEEIQEFLDLVDGHERVLFGTDYPIQSYADSLDLVSRLNLNRSQRIKMLAGNAANVLDPNFYPRRKS